MKSLRALAAAAVSCLVVVAPPASAQGSAPEHVTVATARARASRAAVAAEPIEVAGAVTYADAARKLIFVQDATGGIAVQTADATPVAVGSRVTSRGRAAMTPRGPTLVEAAVAAASEGPAAVAEAFAPSRAVYLDGSLVTVHAVVRRASQGQAGAEAELHSFEYVLVLPLGGAAPPPVDSVVTVQGVFSNVVSDSGAIVRRELLVASPSAVRVESRAQADPFAAPAARVGELPRQPGRDEIVRRVRVSGVVTRRRPGRSLYIAGETGALYVETSTADEVAVGDRVEVVGFPELDDYSPYLADAVFRRVGRAPRPEPSPASFAELIEGRYDAALVTVDARFVSGEAGREDFTLVMQDGDLIFNAQVPLDQSTGVVARLKRGMQLRLTGICSVIVDTAHAPRGFRLLLRDASDVTIVAGPGGDWVGAPWATALGLLLGAGALVAAFVFYRRGRSQEATIRRQLAREASLKARFDDVFDRSSEIMVVHDRRGRVSTINRAGEQATGYSRDELRMLDPSWIFTADYLEAVSRMIEEGGESAPRTIRSELVPRRGGRIPVEMHSRVLVGDGQVVGVTTIARDLSERERLENELRQAQKMEAVGRLATGIAHDFNNLITVLLGYSDELIEQLPEQSAFQKPAQEIRRAAERASGLTQQLLSFSRRQTSMPQMVDVNLTVANMEDLMRRLLGPEVRIEFSLAPDLGRIRADAAQIGQVLMNLIVNARDAMPTGGTLGIETANVELGPNVLDVIPGPHVMLSVRDTGVGMSHDVRDRLFEPFFTTKETGQGTGLGLSMVHAIVRQAGGHITVDSEPGQGSVFRVYFPRVDDTVAATPPRLAPAPARAVPGEGVVLLAEDDRSVRRLVSTELSRRGYTVLDAEDGQEALDVFKDNRDRIDIVVTDVVMPRMNGADLAKAIEQVKPHTKVLFISGHPERAGQGLDPSGVANLLMKPFTADVLAARIRDLMAESPRA